MTKLSKLSTLIACLLPLSSHAGSTLIDRQLADLSACSAKADWRLVAGNLALRDWIEEDRETDEGYHCLKFKHPYYEFRGLTIVEICGIEGQEVPFYIDTNNSYQKVKDAVGYISRKDAWVSSLGVFDCNPRG